MQKILATGDALTYAGKTVQWYLDHPNWVANGQSGGYRDWLQQHYKETV